MSKELEALERIKTLSKARGMLNYLEIIEKFELIEKALKRIDFLERVNKDLNNSENKLNKIIENRIVYNDYNFQSIKKFVACKSCQYYENEKCMNKYDCFWLDLERKLKALEIIKEKDVDVIALKISINLKQYNCKEDGRCPLTQEEYDLLKEVFNYGDKN